MEELVGQLPGGWENLTLCELRGAMQSGAPSTQKYLFKSLDTNTALRAYAIVCVVTHHLGLWDWTPNGSVLLLLLAGVSFGRFQLPEILRSGRVSVILNSILVVAVPTIEYIALNQIAHREGFLPGLLMVGNFWPPHSGFDEWFLEIYVQIYLILAIFLCVGGVPGAVQRTPLKAAVIFFLLCCALHALVPLIWNTHYLANRLPHMLLWLFAGGLMLAQAKTSLSRACLLTLLVFAFVLFGKSDVSVINLAVGAAVVSFLPALPVPAFLRRPVAEIASASLFVYLTHFQTSLVFEELTGLRNPALLVFVALLGGIFVARAYAWLQNYILKRFTFGDVGRVSVRTVGSKSEKQN